MTVYIGVDFHPYEQSVAYCDESDGEVRFKRFLHSDKQSIKAFYRKCGRDAVVGVEAAGYLWWFEKLLAELGMELRIGDPRMIRRAALSRHKNDFRDAETMLDLLMRDQFPRIVPRSEDSREVLDLLHYRESLVQKRTSVANQLQGFARRKGLARTRLPGARSRKLIEAVPTTETERLLIDSRFRVYDELTSQIESIEARLEEEATKEKDGRLKLLRTHPGVGPLTSLALVHTLGDVRRFRRKDEVVAFVGLDPLEKSSGEKRRIGSISKHGSRLLRHLLGQAAQTCRDTRIRQFYNQVSRRRGRPKAKVAAARKLLINCYVMLRDGIGYEEFTRRGEVGLCEGLGKVDKGNISPFRSLND